MIRENFRWARGLSSNAATSRRGGDHRSVPSLACGPPPLMGAVTSALKDSVGIPVRLVIFVPPCFRSIRMNHVQIPGALPVNNGHRRHAVRIPWECRAAA